MERAQFAARVSRALSVVTVCAVVASIVSTGCGPHSAGTSQPASSSSSLAPVSAFRPPAEARANGFPATLVNAVEELICLTAEYNALAAKVESLDSYRRHAADLQAIEERLAVCVAAVTFGEANLPPAARQAFDERYFATRALPLIEEKRAHQRRFKAMLDAGLGQPQRQEQLPEGTPASGHLDCLAGSGSSALFRTGCDSYRHGC